MIYNSQMDCYKWFLFLKITQDSNSWHAKINYLQLFLKCYDEEGKKSILLLIKYFYLSTKDSKFIHYPCCVQKKGNGKKGCQPPYPPPLQVRARKIQEIRKCLGSQGKSVSHSINTFFRLNIALETRPCWV